MPGTQYEKAFFVLLCMCPVFWMKTTNENIIFTHTFTTKNNAREGII